MLRSRLAYLLESCSVSYQEVVLLLVEKSEYTTY
jgi:hypothetical protein